MFKLRNFVDKIYCINIHSRPDRWERIQETLKKLDIADITERVDAVEPKDVLKVLPEYSDLRFAHSEIMSKIMEEYDVTFSVKQIKEIMNYTVNKFSKEHFLNLSIMIQKEYANKFSFANAMQKGLDVGAEKVLILEDDVKILYKGSDINEKIAKRLEIIETVHDGWELIYLGGYFRSAIHKKENIIRLKGEIGGAHAIIYKKRVMNDFISDAKMCLHKQKPTCSTDNYLHAMFKKYPAFCIYPIMLSQLGDHNSMHETIESTMVRLEKMSEDNLNAGR